MIVALSILSSCLIVALIVITVGSVRQSESIRELRSIMSVNHAQKEHYRKMATDLSVEFKVYKQSAEKSKRKAAEKNKQFELEIFALKTNLADFKRNNLCRSCGQIATDNVSQVIEQDRLNEITESEKSALTE